jgi:maltose O-acetyltransferase
VKLNVKTNKEKMLSGEPYLASDPQLVQARLNARWLTWRFNQTLETEDDLRKSLLKKLLGSTGNTLYIRPPFHCDYGYNIIIGENFFANLDCVFVDVYAIRIGDNCFMGSGVHIYTTTHPLNSIEPIVGPEYARPVTIGHNVWIGDNVVINPGVRIGDNVALSVGTVVTGDIPDNVVVSGYPAKIIRALDV